MSEEQPAKAESTSSSGATEATETPQDAVKSDKVVIFFKAVGNAPLLKLKKFQVSREASVQTVVDFLRKQLKYTAADPLFIFINCAFQPSPDMKLDILQKCFNTNGKLVVHYSTTQAWG